MPNNESQIIEYKQEVSESFEIAVVAFLNSKTGGHLYIGIADDGSVLGVKNPDLVQRQVADKILNNIKPATLGLFDIISEEWKEKSVIHVIVSSGPEKPYYLKKFGMTSDGCFIRVGSSKHSMTDKMIMEQFSSRAKLSLGKIPSPRQDLSFAQLKIYYEELGKPLNSQFAKTLELLTPDGRYNYTDIFWQTKTACPSNLPATAELINTI